VKRKTEKAAKSNEKHRATGMARCSLTISRTPEQRKQEMNTKIDNVVVFPKKYMSKVNKTSKENISSGNVSIAHNSQLEFNYTQDQRVIEPHYKTTEDDLGYNIGPSPDQWRRPR
jgi:hypothetical protein